jgi:hypothetical protein
MSEPKQSAKPTNLDQGQKPAAVGTPAPANTASPVPAQSQAVHNAQPSSAAPAQPAAPNKPLAVPPLNQVAGTPIQPVASVEPAAPAPATAQPAAAVAPNKPVAVPPLNQVAGTPIKPAVPAEPVVAAPAAPAPATPQPAASKPSEPAASTTPAGTPLLQGRYLIEEQLGVGRLAAVYKAVDKRLQRKVLVHLLRKEHMDKEALKQRFIREAHDSARCSHPSLLEVFDSGEISGRPYMITEYVEGPTLRELGPLSLEDALLYFRQIVGAVAACQAVGIPHPPITSNNAVIVGDGHVEIFESWSVPISTVARDLAAYRPPERTESNTITPSSVVYSLGLLLFEMLTGQRAVNGSDPKEIAQAHLNMHMPALSAVRPLIFNPSLERLLQQATAHNPDRRPPDAAALGVALDELRRTITSKTQRLEIPPVRQPTIRERVTQAAEVYTPAAKRQQAQQVPYQPADDVMIEDPYAAASQPRDPRAVNQNRALRGFMVMMVLIVIVGCGSWYLANALMTFLSRNEVATPTIELPSTGGGLPSIGGLPSLADFGVNLPEQITGVVSGSGQILVTSADLNLRDAPGLAGNVITVLPSGTRLRQIEDPQAADDIVWIRVRAPMQVDGKNTEVEGWLSSTYVKPE